MNFKEYWEAHATAAVKKIHPEYKPDQVIKVVNALYKQKFEPKIITVAASESSNESIYIF